MVISNLPGQRMKIHNNRGFTILEIAMVMVILGIMSSMALVKYRKTVATNDLEKAANVLYLELRTLRSLSFKYDAGAKARFNNVASQCTIWVDTSGNATDRKYKLVRIHKLPTSVKIGHPATPPGKWKFYPPANAWKDSVSVEPDSRGEYNNGAIYLFDPNLPKTIYCIGITTSMQSIELHKWDGKAWTTTPL